MCGIAGSVSFDRPPDPELVLAMLGRIAHRGPDGSGYYRDQRIALGHTRLSIIDVAGGAQPMSNERRDVWVSFNGEIFNYIELREELRAKGYVFRTASDTEVIVHAWDEWGTAAFERFNGQWAIALWESRRERLILCRDRLGIRPLFTTRTPTELLFASEIKSLFVHPHVDRAFDPNGINEVFTFWSTVAPTTPFAGVRQVPPGHYSIIDASGESVVPYWSMKFPAAGEEPSQDLATNAARLRDLIETAARLRFERSDVPVGSYLSGGIDSAITASVVASVRSAPVSTFSLRFKDREYDEGHFQRELVERLGTDHHEIAIGSSDIVNIFPDVVAQAESPLLRSAPAPMYLLSRLARDAGFKVVVTGEGADEVLAGYDIFREGRLREFWYRNPDSTVREHAVSLLYPWLARSPNAAPAFARDFFGRDFDPHDPAMSHRPRWASTAALKHMLAPDFRSTADPGLDLLARMPSESTRWNSLSRAQWLEATTLLPGYILASQGDRMLMANSVEGRFPFLDRDVVEFAMAMPARHKLLGLDEKHVLKRAFDDVLPASILRRPKQPYRAPDASAFFGSEGEPAWLDEVLSPRAIAAAGVFQPQIVAGLVAKCRRTMGARLSNTDNMRILAVISTQLLHDRFITGNASRARSAQPTTVIDNLSPERNTL
jgi:asparagine synthase (glutamine-hydrolysing)